jgi:peptidoglycan/xylan/chitin deacetylase (PgdA/CDA1 family)
MRWVNTPAWLKSVFQQLVWEIPTLNKDIYLTFDDGPTPGITPQVLALLFEHNAKATFFCLGSNIELYPELLEEIKAAGHAIGNHGYNHLSGFSTSLNKYIKNVEKGAELSGSRLFRPPYGRITPWQVRKLRKQHAIIMWSIMSMDFDARLTPEQCLQNVIKNIKPGAIIIFHDSDKAKKNLLELLPKLLNWLQKNGYETKVLDE